MKNCSKKYLYSNDLLNLLLICVLLLVGFLNPGSKIYAKETSSNQISMDTDTSPMAQSYNFTPRSGNVKALVFMVEFADVSFEDGKTKDSETVLSAEELQTSLFGDADIKSANYPYESVKAYYERASYNQLHFAGQVLYYKTKHNRKYYDTMLYGDDKDAGSGYETLMMEVLSAFKDSIDFADYDANDDGILDAIYLSVPINSTSEDSTWWGNQSTWWVNPDYRINGKKINQYVILDGQPLDDNTKYYNQIWIHETGHLLGIPDYYHVAQTDDDDWEGFKGEAGHDIMDEMQGDHNSFSKIMCGWINKKNVKIVDYNKAKSTFLLKPYEESPSALIIPIKKWKNNFCSEYYLIEYDNGSENNTNVSKHSGIRIWHVDAKLTDNWWNSGYKMFAYDQNMTGSKRILLDLMKNKKSYTYYQPGDSFTAKSDIKNLYSPKKESKKQNTSIKFEVKIGKQTKDGNIVYIIRK